jgi:hypothetical protein
MRRFCSVKLAGKKYRIFHCVDEVMNDFDEYEIRYCRLIENTNKTCPWQEKLMHETSRIWNSQ